MTPPGRHARPICFLLAWLSLITPPGLLALELPGARLAAQSLLLEVIRKFPGKDPYHVLNHKQRVAWSWKDGHSYNETLAALTSVPVELVVEVRLVGMNADGNAKMLVPPSVLLKYLNALQGELDTVALQPQPRRLVPLAPHVTWRVTLSPPALCADIQLALHEAQVAARAATTAPTLLVLPHGVVDTLVNADWEPRQHSGGTPTFTLYVLNPNSGQEEQYAYGYDTPNPADANRRPTTSAPLVGQSSSFGSVWSSSKPYAWIDLTAGPLAYGPKLGQQGQVLAHSLPRADRYKVETASFAIVPDLAALSWTSVKHLVWPPVHSAELEDHEEIIVQIVHMHDTLAPPSRHLDAGVLLRQLQAAVPSVKEVKESWISFADCDLCAAAFVGASKLRTARDMPGQARAVTRTFLDRPVLAALMRRFKDRIYAYANIPLFNATSTERQPHILPVFLFAMSQDAMLLMDDDSRAAAFPDMVLAVATQSVVPLVTHFTHQYQRVSLDATNITREVLAAIMQSGWGVAHTAAYHSKATGENTNYLWALGNTPFGPFSRLPSLSATQAHAALRNVVAVLLDGMARRIEFVMKGFAIICPGGRAECSLDKELMTKLQRRLNMYQFKVQQAAARLGAWDGHGALAFARSAEHDAKELEIIGAYGTVGHMDTIFLCEGHIEMMQFFVYPTFAMVFCLAAVALRLKVSKPKAEKQY